MNVFFEFFNGLGLTREQQGLIMRATWFGFVSFHILWVCGWLTLIGLESPFVHAEDMRRQSADVHQAIIDLRMDRIERLEHDILQLRVSQCQANTPESRRQYGERLAELISRFQSLAAREPRVPRCDEI